MDKKAPINYKFLQQQQYQPQDQLGKSFESDREYRLKLREQERQRMNNQNGEEGLKYGALQIKPAEIIKPTDLIDHEYHFKSQSTQIQNNLINGQIQYNPIDMNYLSKIKNTQQYPFNQQQFSQNYQNQYNVPENQNYLINQSINDRDFIQNQIDYNQQYIPNQINVSQQFNQYELQNQQIPKLNNENQLLRRSSKSKLNLEYAKELDQNLSQIVKKDSEMNQQNNFINYRMQDQAQKRQKQIEYQEMLDKQRLEKQQINQNQVQSPQQTGRIKEKLYSARKLSQNIDDPQQHVNFQNNNQKMQYARSNSQYQESRIQDNKYEDQFQKQQNNPIRRMGSFNQDQQLSGRESKQNDSLIFGGYLQIGNPEMKDKQEKIRKQKEYRDYLDMQKNQDKNRFDNIPIQKPPIPAGPNQISKQLNRPPSGLQKAQIPRQDNKNDSFIYQGKSNWDEHFLQERRTKIGDQIFEQVLKKQAPQNQKIVLQNQDIKFSEQYLVQQNRNQVQSRQQMKSIDFKEQNPFVQQSEDTNKQKDIDRKKEYAMELQKQINKKKQMKERQNSIEISQPQKNQEFKNINQYENKFQNHIDSHSNPQEQFLNYNQNENHQYQGYPQEYQNDFKWDQQMENDPLFQQILERKKQELMRKYQEDAQQDQQYQNQNINYLQQPQYIDHGQKPSDIQYNYQEIDQKQNQIQPNQYSEADLKRLKREEYKRELDEQVRLKEQSKTQKQQNQEKPNQKEQDHISQLKQIVNDEVNQNQNNDMMRIGVRNRTDITKVDNQENKEALIKKLAYQEELRLQMEEKQRQKEIEKERLKKEEEKIEREILIQRQILEQKENKELIKEGKVIQDEKPKRQINRQQFETSDAIIGQQTSNVNKIEQIQQQQIQDKMELQDQNYIKQEYNIQQEYNIKQDFDNRNLINQQEELKDFGINNGYQQEPLYQPLKLNQLPNYIPAPQQIDPQTIQMHQKLLEDQQKMIQMYQQALGQILDFRQNYVKESQDMQLVFMKERNQVLADLQKDHLNIPNNLGIPQQNEDIKKQENEISSLNAIQQQLNQLMNKINTNKQQQNSQFTSIINPQVQQNLNELIKTQRDKIVRMSQTLSFREDIAGVNDKTIIKNQQYPQFIPQYDQNVQNKLPFDQFDQSLASHSKLIKVPNQFTNKLREKADNFEQQRLLNLSPNKVPQFTNTQDNIPSDNNTSWFEHHQKSGNSPRRIVNANNKTNNMSNLYQTWQLGPESQASINQRVSVSPNKNQYQKAMQASLAGNSHLQYINQTYEIQAQEYIQSPNQVLNNSQSPQSRQNFHGNNMNQRPLTNNIFPQDTIEELPEREQNMEDDTSTYLDENQVINLADQSQPIHQNKSAYLKDNEEIIKQNINKNIPFQQNSNVKFRGFNQQSIETDQDINNRDDEMTQYSKSVQNRKSKVLSSKNQGFQNQLDANMQYIEQQVNQGQIHGRANSYSRSPLQNDQNNNHFSPIAANQMINIGQVLANAHNKPAIQINTQKSFYKPPLNVINQSNNNMAATGMAGAKPSITGSSFYNATMAKTKQQELNQEQELQKQLMKIFNSAEIFSNNDDEEQKSNIKYQDQHGDEQKKNESNQRIGQTQFRRKKQYRGNVQQQQLEDTEYLESASNINIAQSVAQSMDTNNNLLNFNQILQQPYQQNQAIKGTVSGQFNLTNQNKNLQRPLNQFYTQNATFKNESIIDQQQYSWLMQNNNNIISEQQELEQSKSKSKDEEIVTEYENTVGQTSSRPMQINHIQSQSQLESRQDFQRQNKSELGQTNISEAIWDDPDILPGDDNHENEDKDLLESATNKQSYIQEIYDQNSDALQFDGTNGSNLPQFKIVSIKDENMHIGSLKSNFQKQNIKSNGISLSNQQNLNQSYNTNIRQMNVQASQPYSINQPYNFEPKEDSEVPTSLNHQYNYEDEHSEKQQLSSMKKNYNQKQDPNIKNDSAISGLNLCNGLFQESEPTSAAIIMNDQDFQKLKMYQPILQTISDKESDPVKKALDNELIDQIYEIRNQNRQSYTKQEPFQQQKNMNMDQQQAERIQKNMMLLNQMSSSQDNQKMIHPPRHYNPKQYEINTIKEEREYSSNLQTREVDPILNSTPSLIKINSQISNENPNLLQNEFKIELKQTQQNQIEIQQILTSHQDQSHQNDESFQENTQIKQYNNDFLSNLTNESKNDEDFQEIIKEKLSKINNIFNFEKIDKNISQNEEQNKQQNNDYQRQISTPEKNEKKEIEIEKCSSPRPFKNNISDAKNQELEDLARLIQQATGSVNNIVESSQQLMQSRQQDRMAAAKLRAKQKANGSSVNTTQQSHNIIPKKQEDNSLNQHLIQEDQKNQSLFQDKVENSQSDIKILSNLDQLIQNLEKQQEENIKFQNKFSSSKAYISQQQDQKLKEQNYNSTINQINQQEILKEYIKEEDLNNSQIKEILERNIHNSQQKQNPNPYLGERMQTAENNVQILKNRNITDSECNTEIKEAIMVDQKYQLKLQKQYIRPISGKSALSTSTNRYATSQQTQHVNINSNIKKQDKQIEYQEFNDDDDEAKNIYGNEQDSN